MIDKYLNTLKEFKTPLFKAFGETFDMLVVSLLITLILGLIIGFILYLVRKDGLYENKYIYFAISNTINIVRSIPFILFIIILIPFNRFLIGTGFGVNSSKIPLSIIGVAMFSRFSEQALLEVNKNIYETSYALGANTIQFFRYFLLKEARANLTLSFTQTAISLLSYSTVMGIIGGGGLGYLAISEGYQNFNYPLMWIIIILMIIIVISIQIVGNSVAKHLDKR